MIIKSKEEVEVSVIIVSMNNYEDLKICLSSIIKYTQSIRYEIIVVLYKYSLTSIQKISTEFPCVQFILSENEIRGFSENNNLGIRKAKGNHLLILNDDTYFIDNSILTLTNFIQENEGVKVVSPHIKFFSGKTQFYGRSRGNNLGFWAMALNVHNFLPTIKDETTTNFKTFGISGACFLIEKSFFNEINFFDEYYFFAPEDLAIGEELLKRNLHPYISKSAIVYHKGSSSSFKLYPSLYVTSRLGCIYYFDKYFGKGVKYLFWISTLIISFSKLLFWTLNIPQIGSDRRRYLILAHINIFKYLNTKLTPKELFIFLQEKQNTEKTN